jgi:hypothetical protein
MLFIKLNEKKTLMLVDEIYNEMTEYGHFVDTDEDLFELEKSTIENSNKKDDDDYKSRHSIEIFVEQRIQSKASQIEKHILFVHFSYLIGIGFLCYKLYIR